MLIDPKSPIPIFRQIADQLRQSIEAGVYRPGEMLPSLRQLALDVRVNPNTVQRAYEALEREGVVQTRRGIGIFVSETATAKASGGERRLRRDFAKLIAEGIRSGMTPDKLRLIFETAMRSQVEGASR
jgi:GntR family transcriptional regulator